MMRPQAFGPGPKGRSHGNRSSQGPNARRSTNQHTPVAAHQRHAQTIDSNHAMAISHIPARDGHIAYTTRRGCTFDRGRLVTLMPHTWTGKGPKRYATLV